MWVAIVGSQTFGQCPCLKQPGLKSPAHLTTCAAMLAFRLTMETVTRWSKKPGFEGVVSGGAPGADTLARQACELLGVKLLEIRPRSGPEPFRVRAMARNTRIVAKAAAVVAFFAPGDPSPGTSDTVSKAKLASKPTYVWRNGSWEVSGPAPSGSPSTSSP